MARRTRNGRQEDNQPPVTTTTAIAVLEISSKPGSASDRETANAVALYAPRKGASCIKKMLDKQCSIAYIGIAQLRMVMQEAHSDKSNREE